MRRLVFVPFAGEADSLFGWRDLFWFRLFSFCCRESQHVWQLSLRFRNCKPMITHFLFLQKTRIGFRYIHSVQLQQASHSKSKRRTPSSLIPLLIIPALSILLDVSIRVLGDERQKSRTRVYGVTAGNGRRKQTWKFYLLSRMVSILFFICPKAAHVVATRYADTDTPHTDDQSDTRFESRLFWMGFFSLYAGPPAILHLEWLRRKS